MSVLEAFLGAPSPGALFKPAVVGNYSDPLLWAHTDRGDISILGFSSSPLSPSAAGRLSVDVASQLGSLKVEINGGGFTGSYSVTSLRGKSVVEIDGNNGPLSGERRWASACPPTAVPWTPGPPHSLPQAPSARSPAPQTRRMSLWRWQHSSPTPVTFRCHKWPPRSDRLLRGGRATGGVGQLFCGRSHCLPFGCYGRGRSHCALLSALEQGTLLKPRRHGPGETPSRRRTHPGPGQPDSGSGCQCHWHCQCGGALAVPGPRGTVALPVAAV